MDKTAADAVDLTGRTALANGSRAESGWPRAPAGAGGRDGDRCGPPRVEGGRLDARSTDSVVELVVLRGEEYLFVPARRLDVALLRGTTADAHSLSLSPRWSCGDSSSCPPRSDRSPSEHPTSVRDWTMHMSIAAETSTKTTVVKRSDPPSSVMDVVGSAR
jgi:hypothetical protein